jgi:hypothetical protein
MNRTHAVVAPMVVALMAAAASAQYGPNLLNNAGFESPLGFDFSNVTNWNGFFGAPGDTLLQAFNDTGAAARSGSNALVTTIRNVPGNNPGGFNAFTGHVQTVNGITAGLTYEFSVWARSNPSVNNGAEFRVEWYNAGNGEVGRLNVEIQSLLSSSYQEFSLLSAAPAGAVSARLVMAVQSFTNNGSPADTSVAWDDASFRTIPGPGAAALLGLGGLVIGRRRR